MFGVLRYYLLALWRDNLCLEGPEVGSSGPVTLNLVRYTLAIAHVCGFFIADLFGLLLWTRGPCCCFAFSRPKGDIWAYAEDNDRH